MRILEEKILFKLSSEQKEKIREASEKLGLSMASFCRISALKQIDQEEK